MGVSTQSTWGRLGDGNGSTCSYSSSNCGKTIERPSDIHTRH